jgi:putative DNA primase/helicase
MELNQMTKPVHLHNQPLAYLDQNIATVLPDEIKKIDAFITWKSGPINSDGKFDKFPFGRDGTGNQWQKSHQWMSFEDALYQARIRRHSGIGFVLPAITNDGDHVVALDYDSLDLKNTQNNLRLDQVRATHEQLESPYIEESPSGQGLRMFVLSKTVVEQISCPNPLGGKDELFCGSGKWVTITGFSLGGSGVPEVTQEINKLASLWQSIKNQSAKANSRNKSETTSTVLLDHLSTGLGWKGWPEKKLKDGDGREEHMLSYAGHLRRKGFDQNAIESMCLVANVEHYEDHLDEDVVLDRARRYADDRGAKLVQLQDITSDVLKQLLEEVDHTDAGNVALLFNLVGGDIRYIHERKQWMVWLNNRWQLDAGFAETHTKLLLVAKHYKEQAKKYEKDALAANDSDVRAKLNKVAKSIDAWATQCRNKSRLDNMLNLAQRDVRFIIGSSMIDKDPWLLGVENGVIDLRAGVLRPDIQNDFVLKRSSVSYDSSANADRWQKFISEITAAPGLKDDGFQRSTPRPHLAAYLQKVLGYCVTGKVNEHLMFIAIGSGANGKNVLLDTFKAISGDYSESISPEVLMCSKFESGAEQATPGARKLAGARCAISSESKDGHRLDVAIVKRHTGGGMMTARALHENPITFEITHKLWLMTNHTPRVDHMDDATKGRLHVIPFDMKWNRPGEVNPNPNLPNADKNLIDSLKSEYSGILNWLIQGAVKYHTEGLLPPEEVVAFTRSYIESQDLLERWLREECTRCDTDSGMLSADLLKFYTAYCNEEEVVCNIEDASKLSRRLGTLGYESKRTNSGKKFGVRVTQALPDIKSTMLIGDILSSWDKDDAPDSGGSKWCS